MAEELYFFQGYSLVLSPLSRTKAWMCMCVWEREKKKMKKQKQEEEEEGRRREGEIETERHPAEQAAIEDMKVKRAHKQLQL